MVSRFADNLAAARLLYLLVQPFEKSDAFKLGIIDKDGKSLKKPAELKTDEEKNAYDYLHRIVFKLKKLIGKLPGGKTQLATLAAAYLLIRDSYDFEDKTDEELLEAVVDRALLVTKEEISIMEDVGISTAVGNVAGMATEPVVKKRVPLIRRETQDKPHLMTFSNFVKLKNK